MSSELIRKSALKCFSINGYEGTSLSMITDELGMKKQSVYAHYRSKEDIFMSVLDSVLEEELDFMRNYFGGEFENAAECFDGFVTRVKERSLSEKEGNIMFILRTSYMPPEKMRGEVSAKTHVYWEALEEMVCSVLEGSFMDKEELRSRTLAMTTLIDGLLSALLYCGTEVLESRQKACSELFIKPVYSTVKTGKERV
jgi:AcrR family transcriptional regulator